MTPAPPSLLAAAGILAVAGSLDLTGASSPAGAAASGAARAAPRSAAAATASTVSGSRSAGGPRLEAGHPAEVTAAAQARAVRYWTAPRMARARTLTAGHGGGPADPMVGSVSSVTAPARVVDRTAHTEARPAAAAVLMDTATAAWPGGGAVAGATGKVYFTMDGQDYVCSGAVVASANADVVITAGHCVKNGRGSWAVNWTFVPGFTQGSRPYGSWTARHFFAASQWTRAANDNYDVAFVTLNPQYSAGHATHIGQVADALPIAFSQRTAEEFAFGYPAEPPYSGGGLYYCSGRVTADAFHASPDSGLRCVMTAGSSGGPWLSGFDPVTGAGTITSVSSFKYSTDRSTLYGPPLGAAAQALYEDAQRR